MIDLHYWTTPNGHKITMFLEETGLPYKIFRSHRQGRTVQAEFLAIAPNNRIPAMVDHEPKGGGKPISIFESGAMLLYLAEKTGKFLPSDLYGRYDAIQWTFWQMGGLVRWPGRPSLQKLRGRKDQIPIDRYVNETNRLYGVLNSASLTANSSPATIRYQTWRAIPGRGHRTRPEHRRFPASEALAGNDSGAARHDARLCQGERVNPNFGQPVNRTEEERRILFGQTAAVVR